MVEIRFVPIFVRSGDSNLESWSFRRVGLSHVPLPIPHSFSSRRSRVNFPKTRKFKEHLVPRLFPTSFRISTPAFSASSFNLLISGLTWAIWGSLSTQNLYGMIFLSSVEPTINQRGLAATQLPILAWIDPLTHSLTRSLTHSLSHSLSINQSINQSINLSTYLPS